MTEDLTFEYRRIPSKFRCNDHTLLTEKGRHTGLQLEQSLCKICQLNLAEDEIHFLTISPEYDDLRAGLFSTVNVQLFNTKTQFSNIMRSENTTVRRCLAEFTIDANKLTGSHPIAI